MSTVVLTGLRAGTPLGFLATLGAFRHLSEMSESFGDIRLCWARRGGEWLACIVTGADINEGRLLEELVRTACTLRSRPEFNWADQIKKNTVDYFRRYVGEQPESEDWFAAFASELALSGNGTLNSTDFDMTGGQQKFLLKLREASASLSASADETKTLLREALFGPWLYAAAKNGNEAELSHSLGLDPSTLLQGAFTAREPSSIKDKRGVRGAIWLAFESLPLFPCAVSGGRLRTTGFFPRRSGRTWQNYFEWGVWETPLTLTALRTLLLQSRAEWTPARGITQRFRSERVNLNKDYYSLSIPELVVE